MYHVCCFLLLIAQKNKLIEQIDGPHESFQNNKLPIVIVYWTHWFGKSRRGNNSEFFKMFHNKGGRFCPMNDILLEAKQEIVEDTGAPWCVFTHNKDRALNASAFVFHAPAWNEGNLPRKKQPWVIDSMESPAYYKMLMNKRVMRLFRYSMTYRLDSDFPLTYAAPVRIVQQITTLLPPGDFYQRRSLSRGEASILWLASNCQANNGRSAYVAELMKHVPIDCLGGCMNNGPKIPRERTMDTLKTYILLPLTRAFCMWETFLNLRPSKPK